MRSFLKAVALSILLAPSATAQPGPGEFLLAHDINGVATGMTVAQAAKEAGFPLEREYSDVYEGKSNALGYQVHLNDRGLVKQIDYFQRLGDVANNPGLWSDILVKLVAKYGNYSIHGPSTAVWRITRAIPNSTSRTIIQTMEASLTGASINGKHETRLNLSIVDYTIRDGGSNNSEGARKDAANSAKF